MSIPQQKRYISISIWNDKPCTVKKEERVIIRRKKERDFTIIGNSFAQDNALSWKSRGLFLYIYSLPEDWNIHETELLNHSPDGRYGTHAAVVVAAVVVAAVVPAAVTVAAVTVAAVKNTSISITHVCQSDNFIPR